MVEPPSSNAVHDSVTCVFPGVANRSAMASGTVAAAVTAAVAALVSVSALLASSVKLTLTLIALPRSAATSV